MGRLARKGKNEGAVESQWLVRRIEGAMNNGPFPGKPTKKGRRRSHEGSCDMKSRYLKGTGHDKKKSLAAGAIF